MNEDFEDDFRTEIQKSLSIGDPQMCLFWPSKDKEKNMPSLQKLVEEGYCVGAEPLFCSDGFLLHVATGKALRGSFKVLPARVTDERGVWVEAPSPRKW
jgi:hypothetical protein